MSYLPAMLLDESDLSKTAAAATCPRKSITRNLASLAGIGVNKI